MLTKPPVLCELVTFASVSQFHIYSSVYHLFSIVS